MNKAVLTGPLPPARGQARAWWGRLTDGDLDRTRQYEGFIGRLQARYGFSRERAARLLRRRMLKHRASRTARGTTVG